MKDLGKNQTRLSKRKRATLIGVGVAAIMLPLDITSVGVALGSIGQSLGASFTELQWVINAYNLFFCAFLLTAGSLADLYGRRRMFAFGLSMFIITSLLCGISQGPLMLNFFRALEGLSAALILPSATAALANEFRGAERGKVFGILGSALGLGLALGPIVGGALTTWLGWRSLFLVNVPVGFGVLVLAVPRMSESSDPSATRVDWPGLVTFTLSLFSFNYALIMGQEGGWGSPLILGALLGCGAFLALFIVAERLQRRPMFDLGLFRKPTFVADQILVVVESITLLGPAIYLPLYLQGVSDYSPLQTGLAMLPFTLPLFIVPSMVGWLVTRLPLRLLLSVGYVLIAVGLLWTSGSETDSWTALLGGLVVTGVGLGTVVGLTDYLSVSVVPSEQSGMASGIFNTMRIAGDAIGVAGAAAILIGLTQARLRDLIWGTPAATAVEGRIADLANSVVSGNLDGAVASVPAASREVFLQAATQSYTSALNAVFIILACLSLASIVVTLALVRARDLVEEPTS